MTVLGDVVLRDTFANLPAAGTDGRLFADTTNSELLRDNGASWDTVADIGGGGGGGLGVLQYDFTITGADQASIDTNVDGAMAGLFATTYHTAKILCQVRTDDAGAAVLVDGFFNNDSATNYDCLELVTDNATISQATSINRAGIRLYAHGSGGTANMAAALVMEVPNYGGTTWNKTGTCVLASSDGSGGNQRTGTIGFTWLNTAALTRFRITAGAGQKLKVGSRVTVLLL